MNRAALLIIIILILAGCGGTSIPTLPDTSYTPDVTEGEFLSGDMSLGIWEVNLDTETMEVDYQMVRGASAIGTSLPSVLLSPYLTSSPCSTCMRMDVMSIDYSTKRITLSIGLRHPIAVFNGGEPITAANRADLDVFNVMGVVIMPENGDTFNYMINGSTPLQTDPFMMINPDGYTHTLHDAITNQEFLNPNYLEPISTLNPFKYFFIDLDNRRFIQGAPFEMRPFIFDLSRTLGSMTFYVAFRASYGQSATYAKTKEDPWQPGSRGNPMYFLPEFNQTEAYDVTIEQIGEIEWGDTLSTAEIKVTCLDYQAGLTGAGRSLFETDPLDAISFTSDVSKVVVDIPALSATPFETTTRVGGTGVPGDPYIYNLTIQNHLASAFGTFAYFAIVEDNRLFDPIQAYQIGHLTVEYNDSFDPDLTDSLGWTVTTYRGEGWAIHDPDAGDGNVWDESNGGDYDEQDSTRLTTPVFDLSYGSMQPVLEITHAYNTQLTWDGCSVFLSTDGGVSFDYSAAVPVLAGKEYDDRLGGSILADTVLAGRMGFTGSSSGVVTTQFDLTKARFYSQVCVQFVFEADQYTQSSGWEIRNVKILP